MEDRTQHPQADLRTGRAPLPAPGTPLAGLPPAASPVSWGSLAILEKIGEDSFGEIFRAHDPELGREVTLKLRPPNPAARGAAAHLQQREARFLDEARRLATVRHSNVLVVHGADRRDGRLGYWMDRVEGRTLAEHLQREGPLPAAEVRRVGLDLCRALAAIHAAGIIHRQVRATSVVRDEGGRVVLMDSGALGELPPRQAEAAGDAVRAMAPEQLLGEGLSLSTDVYGLGVLLYRLSSGHHPAEGASVTELIEEHRRHRLVPVRDRRPTLPLDFAGVIETAIDPEPAHRFPNIVAMERALTATLVAPMTTPAAAAPDTRFPAARIGMKWQARWSSPTLAVLALAFGLVVAVMLLAEPKPAPAPAPPPGQTLALGPPALLAPPAPLGRIGAPPASAKVPRPQEDPEEAWTYKPIPRSASGGPPGPRTAPPGARVGGGATPRPPSGAVAGATAMLRALARGPAETRAPADSFAYLTLASNPERAQVTIDGERQREPTNATYRLPPGTHSVLVEKLGYVPQQMPPLQLAAGQRLRASLTLAVGRTDTLLTP